MKKLVKYICMMSILCSCWAPIAAQSTSKDRIFPEYTGITAQVTATRVNVRNYPSKWGEVMMCINHERVQVLGQNKSWYKVRVRGEEGWIYKEYVASVSSLDIPYSKVLGEEIVDYAKQFIGTPYVWGGNNLRAGVDCSGLTQEVFADFDIDISRVSYMQAKEGKPISKDDLRPGDLVFFDTTGKNDGNVSHVGIYVKDNQFLHADSTHGVMISSLASHYYVQSYVGSRRLLNEF